MSRKNNLYLKRKFPCAIDRLYEWLTDPEYVVQWFGPRQFKLLKMTSDLREGGTYSIILERPDRSRFEMRGSYLLLDPPYELHFSMEYRGWDGPESLIKMQLESDSESQTLLHFSQSFQSLPKDLDNRTIAWESMFDLICDHLLVS